MRDKVRGPAKSRAQVNRSRAGLVKEFAGIASEIIGTQVSVDAPLMSVGLDSIGATELSTRLSERLKTELSPTLVFDHPTLQSIVSSLSIDYDLSIDSTVDASTQRHDELVHENAAVVSTPLQSSIRDSSTILKTISAAVMEVLGSSPPVDTPLMSAGLDSIAVTEFVNILAKRFDRELPSTLLFDHPTINSMATYIAETTEMPVSVATIAR